MEFVLAYGLGYMLAFALAYELAYMLAIALERRLGKVCESGWAHFHEKLKGS